MVVWCHWCLVSGAWCVAAGDRWHINSTKQLLWAMSHCLCANCNGTHPGECEECVPRSPGCDVRPPEFDCWMDVRTRTSGWPLFDSGVGLSLFLYLYYALLRLVGSLVHYIRPTTI